MKTLPRFLSVSLILVPLLLGISLPARGEEGHDTNASLPVNPASPVPTEARRLALEAAGAFVNDGFRIRDGEWTGMLFRGKPAFLRVTLFQGESYWFVGATPSTGAVLRITVYDAAGKPIKGEQWKDSAQGAGARCAAGVAPIQSGQYFVGVELMENPGGLPIEFSVVYAYK
jgi:hypothetical protein